MCATVRQTWWSTQTIAWYVRAARNSDFHERLAKRIALNLNPDQSILEVGCGLGYITKELSSMGYKIEGIDLDKEAIKTGKKLHGLNQNLYVDDYKTTSKRADVVLAVFCGKVDEEGLTFFEKLANKRIIYVISKHKFNSLRSDKTNEIYAYLSNSGYRFWLDEFKLRFDQPFVSQKEAADFFALQYGNEGPKLKSSNGIYPLVYENEKELSLFVIDLKK